MSMRWTVNLSDNVIYWWVHHIIYLQRARLVLAAKGINYECVNINLKDKPDWFFDLNPVGKVPVIEQPDGAVIYESPICCGRYM